MKGNPYSGLTTSQTDEQSTRLHNLIDSTPGMLSLLLHLQSSPDPKISESAKVAYKALLEVRDNAITSKAYANQRLIQTFEEMDK